MLQVQGNVPDKRLDESLLQPELLLSLIKRFIFNLGKRQTTKTKRDQNKHVFTRDCQAVFPPLSLRSWLGAAMYLGWNSCEVFEMAADSIGFFDNGVHAQLGDLVNERVLVTFPVLHHCGQQRENSSHCVPGRSNKRRLRSIRLQGSFTKVFPAFVLVDVYVDLFDGLQSLSQLGPVVVALRCGSQQLHQQ